MRLPPGRENGGDDRVHTGRKVDTQTPAETESRRKYEQQLKGGEPGAVACGGPSAVHYSTSPTRHAAREAPRAKHHQLGASRARADPREKQQPSQLLRRLNRTQTEIQVAIASAGYATRQRSGIFLLLFILLYVSAFAVIARFRRRSSEDYYAIDEEEATVFKISLWLCTFSLAVSLGAALLLPISILSNEILALYPSSYYVQWLNHSLVQGMWCNIFLFSNLSLFAFLPFAYLFTESEGFPGCRKGIMARVHETFVILVLLGVTVLGMTYVIASFFEDQHSTIMVMFNLGSYYLPFLYSCISFIGALILLLCTPLGFERLFAVVGNLLVKPQFLRDLEVEFYVALLEEHTLEQRLARTRASGGRGYLCPAPMSPAGALAEEPPYVGLQNGELQAGIETRLEDVRRHRKYL
ncbi:protein Lilipod-like, partial [Schistocerca cancellata]|uniref:protein Lilipod-like n=1 Tax=Schistocerca cancellata TaxID=274614 RepID=UPI002118B5C2